MKRLQRWILLLCIIPLISSCNWVALVYDYVDYILLYVVDDYAALTEEQEEMAEARIHELTTWHKAEELPKYIQLTKDMANALDQPVSLEQLTAFEQRIIRFQETSITRFCYAVAPLLMSLDEEQITALKAKLEEQRAKIIKPDKTPLQARQMKRFKAFKNNLEEWIGTLTFEQQQELRKMTDSLPSWKQERYDNHLKNSTEFFALLEQPGMTADQIAAFISQLWASKLHRSSAYKNKLDVAEKSILGFIHQLIENASQEQIKTLQENLNEFAMDLSGILAE